MTTSMSLRLRCSLRFLFFPIFLLFLLVSLLPFKLLRFLNSKLAKHQQTTTKAPAAPTKFAFFHPYWFVAPIVKPAKPAIPVKFVDILPSNAGGGGERVLWTAIRAIQDRYGDSVHCIVLTGDKGVTGKDILNLTEKRFNIVIERPVEFVFLGGRHWIEDHEYPFLTLIGQSLGSLVLASEALVKCDTDVFFDSMGYAFSLPLFKIFGGCRVGCYVHYPTISTDMLELVRNREASFNNTSAISRNAAFSQAKLLYYQLFAAVYGFMGSFADVVMVNSTWTQGHINSIWKIPRRTFKVYPPCDTLAFQDFPLERRETLVISVAQFRPEKNHGLQLEALAKLFEAHPDLRSTVKLALIGSVRNAEDSGRIEALKRLAGELGIEDSVSYVVNASFSELKGYLAKALVGIHTMRNEHFGIGVVEYMAAGLIPLAHNSAGPKMDIVTQGYLAQTAEEYASKLALIFQLDPSTRLSIQTRVREIAVKKFSEQNFSTGFLEAIGTSLLPSPANS